MAVSKFLGKAYKTLFKKHLLVTNTIVSGSLMGFGDFVQQNLEKYNDDRAIKKRHDWARTGRMAAIGVLIGPLVHGWYRFLDTTLQGTSKSVILKKVLADQLIAAPGLLVGFFVGMGMMEGKPIKSCLQELKEKFVLVYTIDCIFWPPVQVINFYYLPPHLRVLYVSSAVLFWDTFLSYIKHKDMTNTSIKDMVAQFYEESRTTPSAK